jgi:hypothetical protein
MTVIEATQTGLEGAGLLPDTASGRAAEWYLGAAVPGARLPEPAEVSGWVAQVADGMTPAEGWPGFFHCWQASERAVAEVVSVDLSAEDECTATVRSVDGREWMITILVDARGCITEDFQTRRRQPALFLG